MISFVDADDVLADAELAARLDELEPLYDAQFRTAVDAIRQLMV